MRFSTSTATVVSLFAASSAVVTAVPFTWTGGDLVTRAGNTWGGTSMEGGSKISYDPIDLPSSGSKGGKGGKGRKRYDSFEARDYDLVARAGNSWGGTSMEGGSKISYDPIDLPSSGGKGGKGGKGRKRYDSFEARDYDDLVARAGNSWGGTSMEGGSKISYDPIDLPSSGSKGGKGGKGRKRYDSFEVRDYEPLEARDYGDLVARVGNSWGGTSMEGGSKIAYDPIDLPSSGSKGGKGGKGGRKRYVGDEDVL